MRAKDKLQKLAGINNLQDLLKKREYEIYRIPNIGRVTLRDGLKELVEDELGDWYEYLWESMFEEAIVKKCRHHRRVQGGREMIKYDEFLKSIIAIGVRFGQENPLKKVDDVTDFAFDALVIACKGKNPIEELKDD